MCRTTPAVVYEATPYYYVTLNCTPLCHVTLPPMICLVWDFIARYLLDMNYILVSNAVGRSICTWEDAPVGAPAQYTALWGGMHLITVRYMCHVMTIYGLIKGSFLGCAKNVKSRLEG